MEVVRAGLEHLDRLSKLFDGYRVFYKQASDMNKARAFLKDRLENNESVIFAVETPEGDLLGFTQLYPLFSSVSARRIWQLNDLFVAGHARRKGVAQMLMDAARLFAIETGAKGLALETGVDNTGAQALYEKLGYEKQEGAFWYFLGTP
ncbi:MAG: N-acetyltransferase family protein [Rhodothermales bacterium]